MAKKAVKQKTGKLGAMAAAERFARQHRDRLNQSVRNEQRVLQLSRQLRRLLVRRDNELAVLADSIGIMRGTVPADAPSKVGGTD